MHQLNAIVKLFFLVVLPSLGDTTEVPCYLQPASDGCHYNLRPNSEVCTSSSQRRELKENIVLVNRSLVLLEEQLIRLGVIPADNTCSELPAVSNGGVVYNDLNLSPGTLAKYICDAGYTLQTIHGRFEYTCTEEGVWDGNIAKVPVECQLSSVRCKQPEISNGTIFYQDNDTSNILIGDVVIYACNSDMELRGPSQRYCLRSGNWSDSEPECVAREINFTEPVPEYRKKIAIEAGVGSTSAVLLLLATTILSIVLFKCRAYFKMKRSGYRKIDD